MTAIFGTTPGSLAELEVISELGRGADTVVYRVRRRGAEYTLKVLSSANQQALVSVRREAALLGSVGHPLLPRIFEVGLTNSGPYLILEYIDGFPLSRILRQGPLDEQTLVRLAIDLVEPLAAAHRAGLVHRDVKPDNVIVEPEGVGRLIDFGLAARGGAHEDRVAGTLLYCAPEQTGMLKRPIDGRSDLYALGVLLYECATGQLPYYSKDAGELIRLHATAPVPDPRVFAPGLSATMAAIISTLLAKDPDDRYQSGEALLADLRRLEARPGAIFAVESGRREGPPIGSQRLVGRDKEVVALAHRWLRAREGGGGAVIVEGPGGAGKTRLVRELTNAVATDGDLTLYGKCVPDDPVPLAPLRGAVERYLRTVKELPAAERERAVEQLRRAAGRGGPLLRTLSPLLADLVQAPEIGELNRHEQFVNAVAAFLVGLAEEFQGAVLHIDDVQWLDEPTRRVLQRITSRLPVTPLLVIATCRDDAGNVAALDRFGIDMDATLDTRVPLGPLAQDAMEELVTDHLGAVKLPGGNIRELATRAGGNPFTIGEYVRAVLDAGLVTPSWEGWRLDMAGLDRLELSGDAVDLVLQRIDGLGVESRRLLAAGAASGRWFPTELTAAVCDIDPRRARALLTEAESRRLVTAVGTDGYRFLHDRIREALLVGLDEADLRGLHQRIAETLDAAAPRGDARYIYAIARHYALGETARRPDRVYASGFAAGRLALTEHAPAEAHGFLEVAARSAETAGVTPPPDFFLALGTSCARSGRFAEAQQHLRRALRGEQDPLRRAEILAQSAMVHNSAWSPDQAFDAVCTGLSELGAPMPQSAILLTLTTIGSVLLGLVIGRTKLGFGNAHGRTRERYRLEAVLCDIATFALSMRMRRGMRAVMSLRALFPINRLGPGREYAQHMAGLGVIADVAGRRKMAIRLYDRAAAVAADLGDPELVAYVEWKRGAGSYLSGHDDEVQVWSRALIEHERWMELGDYLTGVSTVCMQFFKRGCTAEAEAWYRRGRARLGPGAEAEGAAIGAVAAVFAARRGRAEEAETRIDTMRRFLRANPDNPMQLINLYGARMVALIERGELGEPFEQLAAEFGQLGLKPKAMVPEQRIYYVYEAQARLARCRTGGDRDLAATAIDALEKMADTKPLRAFHLVARADLHVVDGRPADAMRTLGGVEVELVPLDAPLIAYEAARVRARALAALDQPAPAAQQAKLAQMIAIEQQWPQRAQWISDEFRVRGHASTQPEAIALSSVSPPSSPIPSPGKPDSDPGRYQRRLEALQQVSLASATVLDPSALVRTALDETLRILGAERAYLFLIDRDRPELAPYLGRDAQGHDIHELTGYSTTLVDRVRHGGEPVVMTGSEEGVALGSHSVQTHGLRSIMVAGLRFNGQLRGVVYLDSRIAKGVFTRDDVDILKAITNHIAVSLETARAAQMEVAMQTARRQRDVAETLRAAMAEQSSSLDPDEVMRRLLASLCHTLGGDTAVLLSRVGHSGLVIAATHGASAPVGTPLASAPPDLLDVTGPRARTVFPGDRPPVGGVLGTLRCWWAVPVVQAGQPYGYLAVGATGEGAMTEAQIQIAAAIAAQGMTAYENARLFSQVRRMATLDGLTGLYNRNHFFSEAERQLNAARRQVAAIMVDIDHFKRINDTYGHPVGDEVIRTVARRLRETVAEGDVVGRYGGEEFAVVTTQTSMPAAELAERLHRVVSGNPIATDAGLLKVTISVGLAGPGDGDRDLRQLMARADAALYQAKQTGRDRVSVAPL